MADFLHVHPYDRNMPKVKFYYFNAKALGEASRMLMAYGGQEFEDKRVSTADWPDFKPKTPFGQMPILEIDGKQYAQSMAIARYLGRKYGLAGASDEEALEIDMYVEFLNDVRAKAAAIYYEADEVLKAQKQDDAVKNVYPELLGKLASIIEKNKGYVALGKLTWADFAFTGMFEFLKMLLQMPNLEDQYPIFKKVHQSVLSIPKVKRYVDNAPQRELPF
nr:glutathione S-transferase sigma 2 [Ectropis grisescens]